MGIIFNDERAGEVFRIMDENYRQGKGVFKDLILPQHAVATPWLNKKQRANFLFFCAILMRGPVNSDDQFTWLNQLLLDFPRLFDPFYFSSGSALQQKWDGEKIKEAFESATKSLFAGRIAQKTGRTNYGPFGANIEDHVRFWLHNGQVLEKIWDGDIRKVFNHVHNFEEAFGRIDHKNKANRRLGSHFCGMRRKIFSLLTIWLQDEKLIKTFSTPIPVDFHAMRFLISTGIVDIRPILKPYKPKQEKFDHLAGKPTVHISEKITDQVAIWSQKILEEIRISHLVINPAIWLLSRVLCRHDQQNKAQNGNMAIDPEELMKNDSFWPKSYRNPCFSCPVSQFCEFKVPSYIFYHLRHLAQIPRVSHPQPLLSGLDWSEFVAAPFKKRIPTKK